MGREAVLPFMVLLAVAFLASLPYTWSILRDYQFRVLNPWPGLYASSYVDLSELSQRLREALNWKNFVALAGVGSVLARADWRRVSLVPFVWLALAALFLADNYASQALLRRGVVLTTLVPGHHAAVYLSAARWVFFGAGAAAFARLAAGFLLWAVDSLWQRVSAGNPLGMWDSRPRLSTCSESPGGDRRGRLSHIFLAAGTDDNIPATLANAACCAAVLAAVVAGMFAQRPYRDWPEMGITYNRAGYAAIHESKTDMYSWILKNTRPDAVFLTEDDPVGLQVVMPAARKLAGAALLIYLNPYVDVQPLLNDQRQMLQAMRDGNAGLFYEAARRQKVTHYLGREKGADGAPTAAPRFFRAAFRAGGLVVYELEPPAVAGG